MNYSQNTKGVQMKKRNKSLIYAEMSLILRFLCLFFAITTRMLVFAENDEEVRGSDIVSSEKMPTCWVAESSDFHTVTSSISEETQSYIYYLAKGYNIDYDLVMAIIEAESGYNSDIISATDDYGLMQINGINHKWLHDILGVTDFLNPEQNVQAGMFILNYLFDKYEEPELVLMAYNLGETGAKRLWDSGIHSTDYTEKVLNIHEEMKGQ